MKYTKIKSKEQYNDYCDKHEELTLENYDSNQLEIELIEILIDEFENRVIATPKKMNPVELISYLIEENSLTKSKLAKELDVSRQLITDILNYRRNISKRMINKLSERFKLYPSAFSKPYKLTNPKTTKVRQTA